MSERGPQHIAIVSPVWNDWAAASALSRAIDAALNGTEYTAELWLIDDGSTTQPCSAITGGLSLLEIHRIRLSRNYGHQQAIVAGLRHLLSLGRRPDGFLVMDCDGEDDPRDIAALLRAANGGFVAAAARASRHRGTAFQLGYEAYKLLFRLCTGRRLEFGNFLYLSPSQADALVDFPQSRRHIASALLALDLPRAEVRLARGARYAGKSRMSTLALVRHGLNAIAVARGSKRAPGLPEPKLAGVERHFP